MCISFYVYNSSTSLSSQNISSIRKEVKFGNSEKKRSWEIPTENVMKDDHSECTFSDDPGVVEDPLKPMIFHDPKEHPIVIDSVLYIIVANRPGMAGAVPAFWALSRRCPA